MANGEELSLRAHHKQKALRLGLSMGEISSTFCYWHSFAHNSFASPESRKEKGGLCWWLFRSRQKFSVLLLSRLASLNRFFVSWLACPIRALQRKKSFVSKAKLETVWGEFLSEPLHVQAGIWKSECAKITTNPHELSIHPSIKISPKRENDTY